MTSKILGNAIFLHVPKTGGTWIYDVLHKLGLVQGTFSHEHADMDIVLRDTLADKFRLRNHLSKNKRRRLPYIERPFIFGFVRHPLTWYESFFRFLHTDLGQRCLHLRMNDLNAWHPTAIVSCVNTRDFNCFVSDINKIHPGFVTSMYNQYFKYGADYIGKQENLMDDLRKILSKLHPSLDLSSISETEKINTSPSIQLEWDPELRQNIIRLEYAGIVRFGYDSV